MTWRTEGAKTAALEARIKHLQRELEAGLQKQERRAIETELAELRIQLEQVRSGRKLL